jgi:rhodanese-related sulfurtransferase
MPNLKRKNCFNGFLFFACIWLLLCSGCGADREITVIPPGALIVDVRTPEEYQSGHYPGAVNIPLDQIESRLDEFGAKHRPIVVYCRSGHRSTIAKEKLLAAGFSEVYNGGGLSRIMEIKQPAAAPSTTDRPASDK